MSMNLTKIALLLALGSLVAWAPAAFAQDKKADTSDAKPKAPAGAQAGQRQDRMKQMAQQLELTEEQQKQVKAILKEEADKIKPLREDGDLSTEDRRAKMKEIRDGTAEKLKKVLKPEQYEKWQKARAQRGPGGGQRQPSK